MYYSASFGIGLKERLVKMLRLLKWAYDLGVRQERTRIARELENEMASRTVYLNTAIYMLSDNSSMSRVSKQRKARLEHTIDVSKEILGIVSKIFAVKYEDQTNNISIMFPEKESKVK